MTVHWLNRAIAAVLAAAALLAASATFAHFNLNLNVRILHVERLADGLRVHLRMPMPYLVADRMGPIGADGLPAAAPFTVNRVEDGRLVHYVDWQAVATDAAALAAIAADGLRVEVRGARLSPAAAVVRVRPIQGAPGFATLAEAREALDAEAIVPVSQTYVGDTLVDLRLVYPAGAPVATYALSFQTDPGLPGQEETANLILDYGAGDPSVRRLRGLMTEPVVMAQTAGAGAATFVVEGVRHILGGPDHVLFVLCLVLGAVGLRDLLARITGFTVGHSVTLSAGFLGYAPSGAWFAPAVETGIALSIIYAAAISLRSDRSLHDARRMFAVTAAIGMLHGLGFSFVLHEILRVDAPNLWESLLAFNIGVEIGQIALVALAWPALVLLARRYETGSLRARQGAAGLCIAVGAFWAVQRVVATASALG